LVPVTIVFAGAGVVEAVRSYRSRRIGALVVAVLAGVVAAVAANVRVNPEGRLDALALGNVGTVLAQQGELQQAVRFFDYAISKSPNSPEPYYNIGLAYRLLGQSRTAIEYLLKAKSLDPTLIEVDLQLAACFEAEGNTIEALRHYQQAQQRDPRDQEAAAGIERLKAKQPAPGSTSP